MSNQRVPIEPAAVRQLFDKLFPGGEVRSTEMLGVVTVSALVWQFTLEARIEKGAAALRLNQQPRKKASCNFTVRNKITSDYRELHAFASDVVQTLAGIAAGILVGIEGDGVDLEYEFKGSDDLIWDAIKAED